MTIIYIALDLLSSVNHLPISFSAGKKLVWCALQRHFPMKRTFAAITW